MPLGWPANAQGGNLYLGQNDPKDGFYLQKSLLTTDTSVTLTEFDQLGAGAPDATLDHIAIAWRKVVHAGVWAQQVQAVTANMVTIAGAGMTTNQWAGRVLSLLGRLDSTQELIVLNMPVSASSASAGSPPEFTLTIEAEHARGSVAGSDDAARCR